MKILWVDDDPMRMDEWMEDLRQHGHTVLDAYNPDEALDHLKTHGKEIQKAVIDIMLPTGETYADVDTDSGMRTGYLLANDIRADKDYRHIRVLLLTNKDPQVVDKELPPNHGFDVLSKYDSDPAEVRAWIEAK